MEETVLCHFLVFCARLAVVGIGIDADTATGNEDTCHLNVLRFHELDEVLHDDIDAILMEAAVITEAEEVELQALTLHHTLVWEVVDAYLCKVRLPCDGTESRELRAVEAYPIVILRVFILESLQHFGAVVLWYVGFLA